MSNENMTRPSEAEVTELMSVGQCEACGGPTVSLARHICEPCKARALSTPPLPSAEPVAEAVAQVRAVLLHQADESVHPLTCAMNSSHPKLCPIVVDGEVELWCVGGCGYRQRHIPASVLDRAALSTPPLPSAEPVDKHKAGLYGKFTVTRNDGKSAEGEKHHGCEYFVLDLDHDPFALPALHAYEQACASEYPALSRDLMVQRQVMVERGLGPDPRTTPPAAAQDTATLLAFFYGTSLSD